MTTTATKKVLELFHLGRTPFKTFDPFLFCMYHNDAYPAAEENVLGPNPRFLRDRDIGMDFSYQDGWSMYHGNTVPGFPEHPHRGFETITMVNQGYVDHSDSINCTARYGNGDTQWMTAGRGIQHAEMFPLLDTKAPNPLDLFQVWLNLPRRGKMCEPYFTMFWNEETPSVALPDPTQKGVSTTVKVVAGDLQGVSPLPPPPDSWASSTDAHVAVWLLSIPAEATVALPPAAAPAGAVTRAIYFVSGGKLSIADEETVEVRTGARLDADRPLTLRAHGDGATVLLLQGKPIGEPVVQHGPFVMNTREEILQCFDDFRRTQFGGWPWKSSDHCHARETPRHALHPNGKKEFPPNKPRQRQN